MKVNKRAYVVSVGEVVVLEYGKGLWARVRVWGKTKEMDVLKTKLLSKRPKDAIVRGAS